MSQDLPKLDVTTARDLAKKPIPETPPDIHKVEIPPYEPDWQKLGTLTIWESLGRIWNSIVSGVQTAVTVISDVQKIVSGLKWVAILIGVCIAAYLVFRFL